MRKRGHALCAVVVVCCGATAGIVACDSSSTSSGTPPTPPTGVYEAGSSGGDPTAEAGAVDGATPEAGMDASASGPRDPFAAQGKATSDLPTAAGYDTSVPGVVTDKATGLVWTKASLSETNLPPDGGDGQPSTQADARTQCANATVGGVKGWRLPTRAELMTVLSFDEIHPFEATSFDASSYDNLPLWIASDDEARNTYYEGHYHIHTFRPNLVGTWFSASTPCVKAPYPVTDHAQPPDASRFALVGSILTDNVTSLEWFAKIDGTARQYTDATTYCASLAMTDPAAAPATSKPWRLPTLKEAASLWLEATKGLPSAFGTSTGAVYFWTSTHYQPPPQLIANPGYMRITFDNTNPSGDFYWDVSDFAGTTCVRDAK